jgi:N-acylneuraminate cytidylyltransferase
MDHWQLATNNWKLIMTVLAVILARAGSIGLKSKHLRMLLGRPVVTYTFDHARAARRLTRTVVTSDCPDVLRLAQLNGFETIQRPAELATSEASVQATMLHALHTVEKKSDFRADALVVLYGNVAVRGEGVIDRAVEHLARSGCDSVRTFCPVGKWHPSWMARLDDDGKINLLHPNSIHRKQDLEPLYLHDGGVVAVTRASMLRGEQTPEDPHAFFGIDRQAIQTGIGETIEIDHERDLYWAEAALREKQVIHYRVAS